MNRARKRKRQVTHQDNRTAAVGDPDSKDAESVGKPEPLPWYRRTFSLTLASGLLLWVAFPPLNWWPLAWVAPIFWLILIQRGRLGGKRPYLAVWLGCSLHWLIMLYGIRLAHPALNLGWVAMSAYLAVYPLLFVGLTRVAVHGLGVSIVLAAPTVWTGMELARGHAITGFSMALLGHTQVRWTTLIQISDILGAYGISFLIMLVAACIARLLDSRRRTLAGSKPCLALWPLLPPVVACAIVMGYGIYRQGDSESSSTSKPVLRVALIQCSFDTSYEVNPKRCTDMLVRCLELSQEAVREHPSLDIIVLPESALTSNVDWTSKELLDLIALPKSASASRLGDVTVEGPLVPPEGAPYDATELREMVREWTGAFRGRTAAIADLLNSRLEGDGNTNGRVHLLAGSNTVNLRGGEVRQYNTALFVDPSGEVLGRYHKMHLVPFGEYVLLGGTFPWLYRLTPMPLGLSAGEAPQVFELAGMKMAPSICFESTVPHLIRWQIASLRRAHKSPDMLVNVTNDGWFKGTSILDYHLACAAFRAVENRLPLLVAANTGFSAFVDANGRIVKQGPRRAEHVIYAEVRRDGRHSWYQQLGDLPAGVCLLFCAVSAVFGVSRRLRRPKGGKRRE